MDKFIIDTNFFLNLEINSGFGITSKDIIINFTDLAKKIKEGKKGEFFMPPRIVDELMGFFKNENFIDDFLTVVIIKSPQISNVDFSADVFYQLVEETRERAYRGLRIAEESVEKGAREIIKLERSNISKIEFEKNIGGTIKNLRERYRQATRFNFLDSVADLDLITLTKEIDGFLISSDEGVIRWGRIFGVKEIPPGLFQKKLLSLCL